MNNLILLIFALQALILAMVCIAAISSLHRRGVQSPSPRRFSLRALLASMTLLALLFGFAGQCIQKIIPVNTMRFRKLRIAWSVAWGIACRAADRVVGAELLVD